MPALMMLKQRLRPNRSKTNTTTGTHRMQLVCSRSIVGLRFWLPRSSNIATLAALMWETTTARVEQGDLIKRLCASSYRDWPVTSISLAAT